MKLIRHLDEFDSSLRHGAVAIGNFDGVHRGHARIVERLREHARAVGGPAVVFTFDPHPVRLLRPHDAPPPLTWTDRKAELLGELGIDALIAYPTDANLLALTAAEFFHKMVVGQLEAKVLVEGPNFCFGRDRQGDTRMLAELCRQQQLELEVVQPVELAGSYISSSRIRQAISAGDVQSAREMLTRPYRIRGMVTHGASRGARIGFPTANVSAIDTLVPQQGVYACAAHVADHVWPAAVNIGPNPTFAEDVSKVEVHLIGFHDSLYGSPLEVDFLARLRDIHTFPSLQHLCDQLHCDVRDAERVFYQTNV